MDILVTGFGPFPHVRVNPTATLARAVAQRLAASGLDAQALILETSYAGGLPALRAQLAQARPKAVLMLGLAARARFIRVELFARGNASLLHPDASGKAPATAGVRTPARPSLTTANPQAALAALKRLGLRARPSPSAGRYLCDTSYAVALAATKGSGVPVIFIHVPWLRPEPGTRPGQRIAGFRPNRLRLVQALAAFGVELARNGRAPCQNGTTPQARNLNLPALTEASMDLSRRSLLAAACFGTVMAQVPRALAQAGPRPATPAPLGLFGLEATQFGLRPGSAEDQSRRLQSALVEAAKRDAPLVLPPGRYRISQVVLPEGARLIGVPGATQLIAAEAGPMLLARRIKRASLCGLLLDGLDIRLGQRSGLLAVEDVLDLGVSECEFANAGSVGLVLQKTAGRVMSNRFRGMRDSALFSLDSRGLSIEQNQIEDCGNNGIQLSRSQPGDDQSIVRGNRINRIRSDAGGDGPNGNGISLYKAGGVIIEGNTLRDCALTFIRNNSGSGVQITGNQGRRCGETAIFSEFAFEGALIANNLVEECAAGINVTNLDHGGRLAVVANNIVRGAQKGFAPKGKELIGGMGVHVEAEAAVTGNVIENTSDVGIALGWSWGMRNLVATGNMVRKTGIGISVSLVPKERNAVIANNIIAGATKGAVVGTEYGKPVTGDLTKAGDARAAGVRVENNAVG